MSRKSAPLFLLPSPPPSSPVTPKQSPPPNFLYTITSFIRSDRFRGGTDLVLSPVDIRVFYQELENPVILSGSEVDSLRYDYLPEDLALTIKAMPSSLHNAVANGSVDVLDEMRDLGFLSRAERRCILMDIGTDVALPTISTLSRRGGKSIAGTACKQPDAAYYFIDKTTSPWCRDAFPRVVFEIGFSQKYETLVEDAKHWLVRAQGFVKVVVLVNLIEGPIPSPPTDIEPELEQQTSVTGDSTTNDGDRTGDNDNNSDADADNLESDQPIGHAETSPASSQSSTAQDYVDYLLDPPTTWVGPISGTIEMFRYDPSTSSAQRDGPQYDLFPHSPQQHPGPSLRISDLLPASHIEADATREFAIPLTTYREHIAMGVRNLAAMRKARCRNAERKRTRAEDSGGEYRPDPRQKRRA